MRTRPFAEIELGPAFHDLDPMGVVWHGHYLKYLELARCALLQTFDYQLAPAGSEHIVTQTDTGVVIYAHGDIELHFLCM